MNYSAYIYSIERESIHLNFQVMKKLFAILAVVLSGVVNGQDIKDLDVTCDLNYIVDYHMIYSDTISSTSELIEITLSDRFNFELYHFSGGFDTPDDLIIGILHPNYPEYVIYGKLCNLEKIFHETNYLEIIESKFKDK